MGYDKLDPRIKQGRYLAALISAALHGVQPLAKPADVTWSEIYNLSVQQQIDCMAFSAASKMLQEEDPALYALWYRHNKLSVYHGLMQLQERDVLVKALTARGVRTMPLKGSVLKEIYPQIHYRQMGDIDLLVEEQNRSVVDKIVSELGYHALDRQLTEHHEVYVKEPNYKLEMHYSLLPKWSEFITYYKDIWEHVECDKKNHGLVHLSTDDMYVYMMTHFANHIHREGENVRILTDIFVYRQKYGNEMNDAHIMQRLDNMGLGRLTYLAEILADAWLTDDPGHIPCIPSEAEELEWLLLASGTDAGFEVRMFNERRKLKEKLKRPVIKNIRGAVRFAFPSQKVMSLDYPFVYDKPYTMPFCWVHRWGRIIVILASGYAGMAARKLKNRKQSRTTLRKR